MVLIPPRTWAANEVLTAALLNTYLRDAILETFASKAYAKGQVAVSAGAGEINVIAHPGIAGYSLQTTDPDDVGWDLPRTRIKVKAVNETRTTTTFAPDADFFFPVQPNETYLVEIFPLLSGNGLIDIQILWIAPGGGTVYQNTFNSDGLTYYPSGGGANQVMVSGVTDSSVRLMHPFTAMVINGPNPGTAYFTWAQAYPGATPTTMSLGSIMRYTKAL